jgi:acetoacetyl-CoA synthetase
VLYDGSPFLRRGNVLFDLAAEERITHFGSVGQVPRRVAKLKVRPPRPTSWTRCARCCSTGSPLSPRASTTSIAT